MKIQLEYESGIPVYRQIVDGIAGAIRSGQLSARALLPSIHELARELEVNPNTVIRAYRELEHSGLVVAEKGRGTFASPVVPKSPPKSQLVKKVWRLAVAEAAKLGLSEDELREHLKKEDPLMGLLKRISALLGVTIKILRANPSLFLVWLLFFPGLGCAFLTRDTTGWTKIFWSAFWMTYWAFPALVVTLMSLRVLHGQTIGFIEGVGEAFSKIQRLWPFAALSFLGHLWGAVAKFYLPEPWKGIFSTAAMLWHSLTFLLLPVFLRESPRDLRFAFRAFILFKKVWRERILVEAAGLGVFLLFIMGIWFLIHESIMAIAHGKSSGWVSSFFPAHVALPLMGVVFGVYTLLDWVYSSVLYTYASEGEVPIIGAGEETVRWTVRE